MKDFTGLGTTVTFLAIWFILGATAIIFQGGHMPHEIDVGNDEIVIAYINGVVYTGTGNQKRTLLQKNDGSIVSLFPIIGGARTYMVVELPATPQEITKWKRAKEILAKTI